MRCDEVRELWLGVQEGAAAAPAGDRVRAHLVSCAPCRAACEGMRALRRDLDEALAPIPGADRAARDLLDRLPAAPTARRPLRMWNPAPLAAAAAFLLVAAVALLPRGGGPILAPSAPRLLPPEIVRMFEDPEEDARVWAARRIGQFGDDAMSEPLGGVAASDPSPRVRRAAVEALRDLWARAERGLDSPRLEGEGS